jgi:hypothetical protein
MYRKRISSGLVFASILMATGCATIPSSGATTIETIRAGEVRTRSLTASDPALPDGSYYHEWAYEGTAGERIRIDMRSSDFDAYLVLTNPSTGQVLARNDDGGEGTDARIELTLPTTGRYLVRTNSLAAGETGRYSLSVTQLRESTAAASTGARVIVAGETRRGELTTSSVVLGDGSYYDIWHYDGTAGERIRIEMRSTDFDAFLSFGREVGGEFETLDSDDDGAGGTDARIDFTLPSNGRYVIRANALHADRVGAYTLSVVRR